MFKIFSCMNDCKNKIRKYFSVARTMMYHFMYDTCLHILYIYCKVGGVRVVSGRNHYESTMIKLCIVVLRYLDSKMLTPSIKYSTIPTYTKAHSHHPYQLAVSIE